MFMSPTIALPLLRISVASISIFTRCTIRNQHTDALKTAVADVSKGQTNMSYKDELQTLPKLKYVYIRVPVHFNVHLPELWGMSSFVYILKEFMAQTVMSMSG